MDKKERFHREEVKAMLHRVLDEDAKQSKIMSNRHREIAKEHEKSNLVKSKSYYVLVGLAFAQMIYNFVFPTSIFSKQILNTAGQGFVYHNHFRS